MSQTFGAIKTYVLGKKYDLSVAFLTPNAMRAVARKTKHTDVASNVLAFPLTKTSGEILLCRETAKAQAPKFGMSQRAFLHYLFIHGLLHIKGHRHGATMEHEEKRVLARFGFHTNGKSSNRN